MNKFTNPLDKIRIAAPCQANWEEMFGDDRRRHCAMCKLNVYNLSEMTRDEAERFLINSEGRVCLRVFRRADGTVITKNCPVGLARIKRQISRLATAAFALMAGFFGGIFSFSTFLQNINDLKKKVTVIEPVSEVEIYEIEKPRLTFRKSAKLKPEKISEAINGRVVNIAELKTEIMISNIRESVRMQK